MATTRGVRAGRAYVEMSLNSSALSRGLKLAERRMKAFGQSVQNIGASLVRLGAGVAAPLGASAKAFSTYEESLAELRGTVNPTAKELEKIETAIADISKATGRGPAEVVNTMTELLKAGLPIETVLAGAATAAIQFARVAKMEVAEAATTLTNAMNVFGVDAVAAMNAMNSAADASSISVEDVAMSFSMVAAVAKSAGLSIEETANAIAILGQNGVRGSDAGTSLKTMLLRLQTGAESAGEEMKKLGINVRNGDGSMKSMREIIGELQMKLRGLNSEARSQSMLKLFGTDAIRAGVILIGEGVAGWDEFNAKMAESLPISEKAAILMDTVNGSMAKAWAAVQRFAIAIGKALGPALGDAVDKFTQYADIVAMIATKNQGLILTVAKVTAGVIAAGAALVGIGIAAKVAGIGIGVLGVAITAIASPLGLLISGLAIATASWLRFTASGSAAMAELHATAVAAFEGIANALKAGDIALAGKILWLSLKIEWQKGVNFLNKIWQDWGVATITAFKMVGTTIHSLWIDVTTNIAKAIGWMINQAIGGWNRFVDAITSQIPALSGALGKLEFTDMGDVAEGQRKSKQDALWGEFDRQNDARWKAAQDALAAGDKTLEALQAELQAALGEAAKAAAGNPLDAIGFVDPFGDGGPEKKKEGIGSAIAAAERKVDVKGSFSAAALRGLGAGDSAMDRTAEATERTAEGVEQLNDRMRRAGPVWQP